MSTQEGSLPETITNYLSADRIGTYLRHATNDVSGAVALYDWAGGPRRVVRFVCDNDVDAAVAKLLKSRGHNAPP